MKAVFAVAAILFVSGSIANAELLPVTADQCTIEVRDGSVHYKKAYMIQTRRACFFVCDHRELDSQYLQLWAQPAPGVIYFTHVQPRNEQGRLKVGFYFERYQGGDRVDYTKDTLKVHFMRSSQRLWEGEATERNFAGKVTSKPIVIHPQYAEVIEFQYRMNPGVEIKLVCNMPY